MCHSLTCSIAGSKAALPDAECLSVLLLKVLLVLLFCRLRCGGGCCCCCCCCCCCWLLLALEQQDVDGGMLVHRVVLGVGDLLEAEVRLKSCQEGCLD